MNELPNNEQNLTEMKKSFNSFANSFKLFFQDLINLQAGIDKEGTIVTIKNNKKMRGANAWLLMCSIMIASLGLDMNSPAIIIGAMLISPLMSPILGIGLAVGITDKETLYISLRHFGVSIAIALITSFLYFLINPLGQLEATEEIISRTEPTPLDAMVAIFGGIAGIISSSRKDSSNAIPGVAIATALMPPLCVAGYGLARAEYTIFLNAFYLFFLNSFFIATSTFIFIRYMRFPQRGFLNAKEQKRNTLIIILFSILVTLPSTIILYSLYQKKQLEYSVEEFVDQYFGQTQNPQCLEYSFSGSEDSYLLALKLLGKPITQDSLNELTKILEKRGVLNTRIFALQDETIDLHEFDRLEKEISGYKTIVTQLELSNKAKSESELKIEILQSHIDSIHADSIPIYALSNEIRTITDGFKNIGYSKLIMPSDSTLKRELVFWVEWDQSKTKSQKKKSQEQLMEYLKARLQRNDISLLERMN
jgi:uncharacterized hydrophobic protein (TIGR00271 family)